MKNQQTKTLGLALGGGGVRGLAHVGVLSMLDDLGIKISAITGTSMGAIVGAAYATGVPMNLLIKALTKYAPKKYVDFWTLNILHQSLMKGDNFDRMLEELFGEKQIEECKIPFSCTAVDIESGTLVHLKTGLLWKAVRASSSLPFLLPPVLFQEHLLVDGGIIDNLPLPEIREYGTDVIMGSSIHSLGFKQVMSADIFKLYYAPEKKGIFGKEWFGKKLSNNIKFMMDIILRTMEITMDNASESRTKNSKPDLLLQTDINMGLIEIEKAEMAIEAGKSTIKKQTRAIQALLGMTETENESFITAEKLSA